MVTIYIKTLNPAGVYQEFSAGKIELEEAVELLDRLVSQGVTLLGVCYSDDSHQQVPLPVAAFDGETMSRAMRQLQLDWEGVLCCF